MFRSISIYPAVSHLLMHRQLEILGLGGIIIPSMTSTPVNATGWMNETAPLFINLGRPTYNKHIKQYRSV